MKSSFTMTEVRVGGKTLFKCGICGAYTTVNRGFYFEYKNKDGYGGGRVPVCPDCDRKYLSKFIEQVRDFSNTKDVPNQKYDNNKNLVDDFYKRFFESCRNDIDWTNDE